LRILFASKGIEELCCRSRVAKKELGAEREKLLRRRLDDLDAADTLDAMRRLPGRCEELRGNRAGQLSLRLNGQFRLVFEPADDPVPRRPDGGLDWTQVTTVSIQEVVDYHD